VTSQLPLDGVLVVSVEQAIAAPFASRQLADLGARVIKIERPGVGDFARAYDHTVKGQASHFVWTNRSKESLALDLKRPEAIDVLRRLVSRADVYLHNLAPGAMGRLGLGSAALRPMDAPASRIFWPLQTGIVVTAAGIGLSFMGRRMGITELNEPISGVGALVVAIGLGFVVSAAASFLLSHRLGLVPASTRPDLGRGTPDA